MRAVVTAALVCTGFTLGCGGDDATAAPSPPEPEPIGMPNGDEPLAFNGCASDSYEDHSAELQRRAIV